jgi:hypothetical protein
MSNLEQTVVSSPFQVTIDVTAGAGFKTTALSTIPNMFPGISRIVGYKLNSGAVTTRLNAQIQPSALVSAQNVTYALNINSGGLDTFNVTIYWMNESLSGLLSC